MWIDLRVRVNEAAQDCNHGKKVLKPTIRLFYTTASPD